MAINEKFSYIPRLYYVSKDSFSELLEAIHSDQLVEFVKKDKTLSARFQASFTTTPSKDQWVNFLYREFFTSPPLRAYLISQWQGNNRSLIEKLRSTPINELPSFLSRLKEQYSLSKLFWLFATEENAEVRNQAKEFLPSKQKPKKTFVSEKSQVSDSKRPSEIVSDEELRSLKKTLSDKEKQIETLESELSRYRAEVSSEISEKPILAWIRKRREEYLKKPHGKELLGKLSVFENLFRELLTESVQESSAPSAPQSKEKEYTQVTGEIIFDSKGGIIKAGDALIVLNRQEMLRADAKEGDLATVSYSPAIKDEWGRYKGKIIEVRKRELLGITPEREMEEGFSLEQILENASLPPLPQEVLEGIFERLNIKYKWAGGKYFFKEGLGTVTTKIAKEIEIFEICNSESCYRYCLEQKLAFKCVTRNQDCDICGSFIGNMIERIAREPVPPKEHKKIVLIGGNTQMKYTYINGYKKLGIDIWWSDGLHLLHKLDSLIRNSDGVIIVEERKHQQVKKKVESACRRWHKSLVTTPFCGYNKVKKLIFEKLISH